MYFCFLLLQMGLYTFCLFRRYTTAQTTRTCILRVIGETKLTYDYLHVQLSFRISIHNNIRIGTVKIYTLTFHFSLCSIFKSGLDSCNQMRACFSWSSETALYFLFSLYGSKLPTRIGRQKSKYIFFLYIARQQT